MTLFLVYLGGCDPYTQSIIFIFIYVKRQNAALSFTFTNQYAVSSKGKAENVMSKREDLSAYPAI